MRQRITFLQEPEESLDPKLLKVTSNSISTKELRAAREDRITFPLDALPQELRLALKASHELHIRWSSPKNYETIAPLNSRVSPGLHVFYTAQRSSKSSPLLCPTLKRVFGDLDCTSYEQSFTSLPVERFSHSTSAQYYQPLFDLSHLIEYIDHKLCKHANTDCGDQVAAIASASSVDIDFDTISHALTITAFWPPASQALHLTSQSPNDRLEVGILSVESPKEPEELSLGGFLTVVGEDSKPSPTLFSFPARHHPVTSSFSSSFLAPTGLHPTLRISISSVVPPTDERTCSLHTHLTLPRAIFADRYQLSDPLFLSSKNLSTLHHIITPVDLEAPEYAMSIWGSSLLLELAPPSPLSSNPDFTAQIPLHLRYLPPSPTGHSSVSVPYPAVFWACVAEEGSKFPINPFDRVNLGYDGLFGPKTMFYHLAPEGDRLLNDIQAPVLDMSKSRYVEAGTVAVVGLGFAWVLWCLWGVWRREGWGSASGRKEVGEKKKL